VAAPVALSGRSARLGSTYVAYICSLDTVKLTRPLERVLRVFLADTSARHYGYDLMKAAGLPSGTLYPMLARLEGEGLVSSQWESRPGEAGGRPPRKYYRLTGEGARVARLGLAQAAAAAPRTGRRGTRHTAPRPVGGSTR
jgi:PadR family transcriptional regulator PadR